MGGWEGRGGRGKEAWEGAKEDEAKEAFFPLFASRSLFPSYWFWRIPSF